MKKKKTDKRKPVGSQTRRRPTEKVSDEMRPEYDFRGGVRAKYADRCPKGASVVLLDPDVAAAFPDSKSVNEILRALIRVLRHQKTGTGPAAKKRSGPGRKKKTGSLENRKRASRS